MLLNLRDNDKQKVFVTSDLHLGHQRDFVWQARGFAGPKEHDDGLIDTINATVGTNDILLMLGDFCLNTTVDGFNAFIARIQCQNLWCLWGNHNNPHEKKVYQASVQGLLESQKVVNTGPFTPELYPFKYRNVTYLGYYVEAVLNGQYTVLCHYPLSVWNEMSHGAWMLCGHSHYGFPPSTAEANTHGKILDCGWDGHKKPWSIPEIREVMDKKQFVAVDRHHVPSATTQ